MNKEIMIKRKQLGNTNMLLFVITVFSFMLSIINSSYYILYFYNAMLLGLGGVLYFMLPPKSNKEILYDLTS